MFWLLLFNQIILLILWMQVWKQTQALHHKFLINHSQEAQHADEVLFISISWRRKNLHQFCTSVFYFETWNVGLWTFAGIYQIDDAQVNGFINVINWIKWVLTKQRKITKMVPWSLQPWNDLKNIISIFHLCFIPLGDKNNVDFSSANHLQLMISLILQFCHIHHQ